MISCMVNTTSFRATYWLNIYVIIYVWVITQARVLCLIYTYDAKGECIFIRQSMSACVITNMWYFWNSTIHLNLKATAQLAYIVTDADCDYGSLFLTFYNVFQHFCDIPYTSSVDYNYSHSYGICIKAFMAVNGEEFLQMNNQCWVIVHVIYTIIIIPVVTLVLWYIIDWHSL